MGPGSKQEVAQLVGHGESEKIGEICAAQASARFLMASASTTASPFCNDRQKPSVSELVGRLPATARGHSLNWREGNSPFHSLRCW